MLEFGQKPANPAATDLIKDSTEATFMQDVIEASQDIPVIVDFWAPWCGPCKTLGPMLESAVTAAKGAVRMVKVNVDQAPNISGQLRIQSIPTVYAFYKGQPVDGFQGAVPQSELTAFVQRVIAAGGGAEAAEGDGLAEALDAADQMLDEGAVTDAAQTFAAILGEEPTNARAYAGMVRCYIALGDLDQAEAVLNGADADMSHAPELEAVAAQLNLARQAAKAGPVEDLRARLDADANDHAARFDLATALHAKGDTQGAIDTLLDLFRRDREWNEGAAKTQLFTIFDALPAKDPMVLAGRRKLSSMIFA